LFQVEALQLDALDEDCDPFPQAPSGVLEGHGTSCAGEVIMEKGNILCGVGVAYNAF